MALPKINLGAAANDGTGDALRTGGQIINDNFDELDERTLNANLQALAGLSGQANRVPYFTGSGALSLSALTAIGRQLIAITQPAEGRNVLGLGSASTADFGVANGAATLGPDGKVPSAQLPVSSVGNVFVVSSETAMLALAAVRGDVAVRTDQPGVSYILTQEPASVLANWAVYNQALSPSLAALNILAPAADRLPYFSGASSAALTTLSAFARTLLDDTDASTARNTLLASPQTQGFIEGLTLVWLSGTSIAIRAGSAYIPSLGKVVTYPGANITPRGVVEVNSFVHLYLTDAGTIDQSLDAPVRYYNQAFQKTGDNTRRYIGSILINTNALGAYQFVHRPLDGSMMYTVANPQGAPFRLLSAGTSIASFTIRPIAPVTAHTLEGAWQNVGTASVQFTPSDAGTNINTGWMVFVGPSMIFNSRCPIAADGTITYKGTGGGNANCYGLGYYFDR